MPSATALSYVFKIGVVVSETGALADAELAALPADDVDVDDGFDDAEKNLSMCDCSVQRARSIGEVFLELGGDSKGHSLEV